MSTVSMDTQTDPALSTAASEFRAAVQAHYAKHVSAKDGKHRANKFGEFFWGFRISGVNDWFLWFISGLTWLIHVWG